MSTAASKNPAPAPAENVMEDMRALSPEEMRERVKSMTAGELEKVVGDMSDANEMLDAFREKEMREALERRMEEVEDVSETTKQQWERLRGSIDTKESAIEEGAEKSFLKELMQKGGIRFAIGSTLITLLAWLGFKSAKNLKASIKEKGFLRTTVEGAKEHPIFTAFIAALGIKAGTDAYRYMHDNRDAIETGIKKRMEETGETIDEAAESAKGFITRAKDAGLRGLVHGLSGFLGGEYNEQTGVVTLPYASLQPPVMIAYAAGVRRRMDMPAKGLFSTFIVEDRLKTIVRQTGKATDAAAKAMPHKKRLAEEALKYMQKGVIPGGASKESIKLEQILMTLQDDLDLQEKNAIKTNVVNEAQLTPDQAKKRVEALQQELASYDKKNKPNFNLAKEEIKAEMERADRDLKEGTFSNPEHRKQEAVTKVQERMKAYQDAAVKGKLALGQQLTDTINGLTQNGGGLDVRTRNVLDRQSGGGTGMARMFNLESISTRMEKVGCKIASSRTGRLMVGAVGVHSLLPIALEFAAMGQSGKAGEAAKKALMVDAAEAGLSFVPGVGEVLDLKASITGKDLNGRDLSFNQRLVSGGMGVLGAASIGLGFFTGGTSIVAFRALRGTVGTVKAVKNVARGTDAVDTSIDIVRAAQNQADLLRGVSKVSDAQKMAITAKKYVDNFQRMGQIATYAHLGYQIYEGVSWVATNTEEFMENTATKASEGIDVVRNFAKATVPGGEPASAQ